MPEYNHECVTCGPIIVETDTPSEYAAFEKEFGRSERGDIQVPCPECGEMAPRSYDGPPPGMIVKDGKLYKTVDYAVGAVDKWWENEVNNTKEVLRFKSGVSPYGHMTADPADIGFKPVSEKTAKARAEAAKKTLGDVKAKTDSELSKR